MSGPTLELRTKLRELMAKATLGEWTYFAPTQQIFTVGPRHGVTDHEMHVADVNEGGIVDIRGHGYLTGHGGAKMDAEKAAAIQDATGELIVAAINALPGLLAAVELPTTPDRQKLRELLAKHGRWRESKRYEPEIWDKNGHVCTAVMGLDVSAIVTALNALPGLLDALDAADRELEARLVLIGREVHRAETAEAEVERLKAENMRLCAELAQANKETQIYGDAEGGIYGDAEGGQIE